MLRWQISRRLVISCQEVGGLKSSQMLVCIHQEQQSRSSVLLLWGVVDVRMKWLQLRCMSCSSEHSHHTKLHVQISVVVWDRDLMTRPVSDQCRSWSWSWSEHFGLVSNSALDANKDYDKAWCWSPCARTVLKVNEMLSPCTVVVNIIARWQNNSFYFITYLLNFILILVRMQRYWSWSWLCSCGLGIGLGLAVSVLVLILVLYIWSWSWSENIGLVSNTGVSTPEWWRWWKYVFSSCRTLARA